MWDAWRHACIFMVGLLPKDFLLGPVELRVREEPLTLPLHELAELLERGRPGTRTGRRRGARPLPLLPRARVLLRARGLRRAGGGIPPTVLTLEVQLRAALPARFHFPLADLLGDLRGEVHVRDPSVPLSAFGLVTNARRMEYRDREPARREEGRVAIPLDGGGAIASGPRDREGTHHVRAVQEVLEPRPRAEPKE